MLASAVRQQWSRLSSGLLWSCPCALLRGYAIPSEIAPAPLARRPRRREQAPAHPAPEPAGVVGPWTGGPSGPPLDRREVAEETKLCREVQAALDMECEAFRRQLHFNASLTRPPR
eukprot:RCo051459